jgi:hypothetical protein
VAAGHHRTQYPWTFWFNRRIQGARTQENYEKNIKKVGTFQTVRERGAGRAAGRGRMPLWRHCYTSEIARVLCFNEAARAAPQVEEFWGYYNHLVRPNDLPNTCDYHVFKRGIKPMWEVRSGASRENRKRMFCCGIFSRRWRTIALLRLSLCSVLAGRAFADDCCGFDEERRAGAGRGESSRRQVDSAAQEGTGIALLGGARTSRLSSSSSRTPSPFFW